MQVTFITRKYPPQKGGMETFSYELDRTYADDHILLSAGKKQRDILWVAPLLLFRALRERHRTSVYHIGDAVLAPVGALLHLMTKKPVVVTVHGLEITYRLLGPLYQWKIRWSLQRVQHVVAVSAHTALLLQERMGIPKERISVIEHGVTPMPHHEQIEARALIQEQYPLLPPLSERTVLLTVGRLVERKGVSWFINEVLPQLSANTNALYLVASTGPHIRAIEAAVAHHHLESVVFLLGAIPDGLLAPLYASADLFVMPNISVPNDVEGFGFVAVEAAAVGLPVLASHTEGIPDAIHHNKNGILVPPSDASAYGEAIMNWVQNPDARRSFGEQARVYTLEHFRWEDVAKRYRALFTSLSIPLQ